MKIELVRATVDDAPEIHRIQVLAFAELYERYRDHDSTPANETVEQVAARIFEPDMDSYIIRNNSENIGAVRVIKMPDDVMYLTSICVLPECQGCGYAQEALLQVEKLYPAATKWTLQTIKQERNLCYLYEKLGYRTTGTEKDIQPGMTLVGYEKDVCTEPPGISKVELRRRIFREQGGWVLLVLTIVLAVLLIRRKSFSIAGTLYHYFLLAGIFVWFVYIVIQVIQCRTRTVCGVINSVNANKRASYILLIGNSELKLGISRQLYNEYHVEQMVGGEVTLLVVGRSTVIAVLEK